jgi:putative oxidoreductase
MINSIFHPGQYQQKINLALLLLRLVIGAFMLSHGLGKMSALFADEAIQFADPFGLGEPASLALAVFAEVFCSFLLILGVGTRLAVIPLMITMLTTVLVIHQGDPFGKKELSLIYLLVYTVIIIAGAGKYSVDQLIYKNVSAKFIPGTS